MFLRFEEWTRCGRLHLRTCLTDWDMNEELNLSTTTDQFCTDEKLNEEYLTRWHFFRSPRYTSCGLEEDEIKLSGDTEEPPFKPSLWLMVDPKLACSIQYPNMSMSDAQKCTLPYVESQPLSPPLTPLPTTQILKGPDWILEESFISASPCTECTFTEGDDDTSDAQELQAVKSRCTPKLKTKRRGPRISKSRRLHERILLEKGGWLRPPVNYCILIAMALNCSKNGSLNVQQIYNFMREHFPFFRTAPDGWKNTIRHNLCFSHSFAKTPQQVSDQGKRKSCLWRLTLDGRFRLRQEIHALSDGSFEMLRRSMTDPGKIIMGKDWMLFQSGGSKSL
ncbi:forkhead box protein R1 isoform X1 [Erpetoichthys calabaricus]|uniref:forkhead box protein R1 isoform X1 n=1 Tax=Erpetoichthys calabaricus TaxID=27687 RepID=UPI00109FA05A|nr:forkhead box protein R1 isoform X1 [Erpetoichthys calabaricus]